MTWTMSCHDAQFLFDGHVDMPLIVARSAGTGAVAVSGMVVRPVFPIG